MRGIRDLGSDLVCLGLPAFKFDRNGFLIICKDNAVREPAPYNQRSNAENLGFGLPLIRKSEPNRYKWFVEYFEETDAKTRPVSRDEFSGGKFDAFSCENGLSTRNPSENKCKNTNEDSGNGGNDTVVGLKEVDDCPETSQHP